MQLEDKLTLCIMGGSQGARSINNAAVEVLKSLSKDFDLQIIFQTGKKNYDRVIEQLIMIYPEYEADKNLIIKPYFDDMVTVLKASEICASGIAPIFVPYPYAAADHQRKNAKFMVDKNAGIYLEDDEINEKVLYETVSSLIYDKDRLRELQKNSLSLAKFDGTEKIVEQLREIANG